MTVVALILLVPLQLPCADAPTALAEAAAHAEAFDSAGAVELLEGRPTLRGCEPVDTAIAYLRGLEAAREAYARGGGTAALGPVRDAAGRLAAIGSGRAGPAEIGRLLLAAAAAAAQSERDEMNAFLLHATAMESLQLAAGQPGAPLVSAFEVAGELWLQVHGHQDARRAFDDAAGQLGVTPRVLVGLGRVAVREGDPTTACRQFRALLDWWGARREDPPEIEEARAYLGRTACAGR